MKHMHEQKPEPIIATYTKNREKSDETYSACREMEERFRRSEERYHALVVAAAQITWATNADGRVEADIPLWRAYSGQSIEEVKGWGWLDVIHPNDHTRVLSTWIEAVTNREVYETECRIMRVDGIYRYFLVRGVPIFEADGTLREWVGISTDITERKQFEETLSQSEERFRATFEQVAIGMLHVDIEGKVIRANHRFCDIIGYTLAEVERMTISDFTHPEDLVEDLAYLRDVKLSKRKQPYAREKRYLRKDGSWVWAQLTVALICDLEGRPLYFVSAVNDITERKMLEEQVTARASQLEAIFETIIDGLTVYNHKGEILRTNTAARHIMGYTNQFYEMSLQERLLHSNVRDEYGQSMTKDELPLMHILRGEEFIGNNVVDIQMNTPDGREVLISIGGAPMRDPNGNIVGAVCLFRNVTERRRLERRTKVLDAMIEIARALVQAPSHGSVQNESMSSSSSRLVMRMIAELTGSMLHCEQVGIISMEEETQLIHSLAAVGISAEQEQRLIETITGRHLPDLVGDPTLITRLAAQESAIIVDLTQLPAYECWRSSDTEKLLLAPIFVDKHFIGLLYIKHDNLPSLSRQEETMLIGAMTRLGALAIERERSSVELSRLLTALQETNAQLERVNRVQSDFISIVGHEFRTTLTSIQGFSELLSEEDFDIADVKEYATDINTDAKRLNRMITDLLDLERMKSGKMTLHLEQMDINTILVEVVEHIRPNAPEHSIRLVLDDTLQAFQGDSDKLTQVVTNFMSNAIKYSPAGGEIVLSSQLVGNSVHVSIKDDGVGISATDLERIFVPYNRVDSKKTRYIKGTGLGLSIVRQIVHMHGGHVWAESTPGEGSTFHFTLPLRAETTASPD